MDKHLISYQAPILEALERLNSLSGQTMTLFAIDDGRRVLGTLTDGDIRRALIAGAKLTDTVDLAMHRDFRYIPAGNPDLEAVKTYRELGLRLLPCLDANDRLVSILDLKETATMLPLSALLMAGGKGERLRPLTLTTPKPLLKIGEKAIIDYNIEALARCGITDIVIATGYLADQIKRHASELGLRLGIDIRCVEETQPLGTIGAASIAQLPEEGNTIVMNSDLLTTISIEDMYLHHIATQADISIAAIPYQVSVPFAVLGIDEDDTERVVTIEEKPSYSYFANAGIYIFPNALLNALPADRRTDATDLIEMAIANGLKVTYFPINGTWIDIGTPADFRQAVELMKTLRAFTI
ncbi:MAG: NTP transferase domain-containing protein [Bacteroidales bacterium]|nr:NTP transferase domain-containing protein [Bacteroidales bacterium]